jgi:hypothetical protein
MAGPWKPELAAVFMYFKFMCIMRTMRRLLISKCGYGIGVLLILLQWITFLCTSLFSCFGPFIYVRACILESIRVNYGLHHEPLGQSSLMIVYLRKASK